MDKTILIVEDDQLVRESLYEVLSLEGYNITMVSDGREALEVLDRGEFKVALIDLRLPHISGMEVLRLCKERNPDTDVLMMTSFGTVETAVQAMKVGATEYLTKPINDDEIKILLERMFDTRRLKQENEQLKQQLFERCSGMHDLIGEAPAMQRIYSVIHAVGNTDTTVLLKGESGTGKGMVARAIHYCDASRKRGPFVEVSCGAIPKDLLESELFGHVKGAFTSAVKDRMGRFELANGGTILLDEIDALPLYLQVKLLRVLQQKEFERVGDTKTVSVDVRIIVATNRDLETEIKNDNFREDLYYRLNVITIDVPSLRERKSDIQALVQHFIRSFNEKTKRNIRGVSREAMSMLVNHNWPGNVRELENFLERAVILSQSDILDVGVFPEKFIND